MAVAVARVAAEAGDKDIRARAPHDAHDVREHFLFAPPAPEGLIDALRETVVDRASEELLDAVAAVRLELLEGPEEAESVEEVRGDDVRAALAAREGELDGPQTLAARKSREESGVFIIGMGREVDDGAGGLEPQERLPEARPPAVHGKLPGAGVRPEEALGEREKGRKPKDYPSHGLMVGQPNPREQSLPRGAALSWLGVRQELVARTVHLGRIRDLQAPGPGKVRSKEPWPA